MSSNRSHWDSVYQDKSAQQLSWFQTEPKISLNLIKHCGLDPDAALIDIGGGVSSLPRYLLESGFTNISVLDISPTALQQARKNLGADAGRVHWIEQDITGFTPPRSYALWHDRAVLHFLTQQQDQLAYRNSLKKALISGGFAIIASFAPDGPAQCSGLPVVQYDADRLKELLGHEFELLQQQDEIHTTPGGATQAFRYFLITRV